MERVIASLEKNTAYMDALLPVDKSFDLIKREMVIGGRSSAFYFIDGFTKDEAMLKIMDALYGVTPKDMPEKVKDFMDAYIPYVEVELLYEFDAVLKNVLSGVTTLFIDGYDACIAIDCRTYPVRSVEEPEKDKSLRGSRDGFVETVVFNTALIRRRIRDTRLVMEMTEVGTSSRTDVVIAYMKGVVDEKILSQLRKQIAAIHVDALPMNQQSLAQELFPRKWFNPFPKFKYTERPDTASECILEGKIVILVDNSPSAMVLPTSIFDMIEEANDYYFPTITNIYLKCSRTLITLTTLFLTPLFLMFMKRTDLIPGWLSFIAVNDQVFVPLIWQFLILEIAIDGLRLAALNTPSMLSTPLSVIAGIVLGEYAVQSGWFNPEVMLYMAFVTVANYSQPNFELGFALKFMRMMLLILTALFAVPGFIIGCIVTIWIIISNKTVTGRSYLRVSKN